MRKPVREWERAEIFLLLCHVVNQKVFLQVQKSKANLLAAPKQIALQARDFGVSMGNERKQKY